MKAGSKLKSAVCDTEVMVIKAAGAIVVDCGGMPLTDERPAKRPAINPALAGGTKIGKRYVNADNSLELLCVKAGQGTLSVNGVALLLKEAKPLPSSD
jgi:hypothetical protein